MATKTISRRQDNSIKFLSSDTQPLLKQSYMTNSNNRITMSETIKKSKISGKVHKKLESKSKKSVDNESAKSDDSTEIECDNMDAKHKPKYEAPTTTNPETGDEVSSNEQLPLSKESSDERSRSENDVDSTTSGYHQEKPKESIYNDNLEKDSKKSETSNEEDNTNLIINYLPQNMTQDQIKSIFAKIGQVISCKLIKDKNTSQNLGYGFVKYQSVKEAEKALATLNGFRVQNKNIKVSLARPSCESIKGANLYISGLPKTLTHQELEDMFSVCGKIITSRLLYDNKTGVSRGVGFVRFDTKWEAEEAIKRLNGTVPKNCTHQITVKLANSPLNYESRTSTSKTKNYQSNNKIPLLSELGYHASIWPTAYSPNFLTGSPDPNAKFHHGEKTSQIPNQLSNSIKENSSAPSNANPLNIPGNGYQTSASFISFPSDLNSALNTLTTNNIFNAQVSSAYANIPNFTMNSSWPNTQVANGIKGPVHQISSTRSLMNGLPSSDEANIDPKRHSTPQNLNRNENGVYSSNPYLSPTQLDPTYLRNYSSSTQIKQNDKMVNAPMPPMPLIPRYDIDPTQILIPMPIAEIEGLPSDMENQFCQSSPGNMLGINPAAGNGLLTSSYVPHFYTLQHPNLWPAGYIDQNQALIHNSNGAFFANTSNIRYPQNADLGFNTSMQNPQQPCCLFAYNLASDIEENLLYQLFSQFGFVRNIKVVRDNQNMKCKGYAFVTMSSFNDALSAIQGLNGHVLQNRILQVDFKLSQNYNSFHYPNGSNFNNLPENNQQSIFPNKPEAKDEPLKEGDQSSENKENLEVSEADHQ